MRDNLLKFFIIISVIEFMLSGLALSGEAASVRILVVMSYDEEYPWSRELKAGMTAKFPVDWDVRYVYLDTKKDLPGGKAKARDAYALYQAFKPDGVIATDDNAQELFVVPFLKDVVPTPVIFCGVNAEPEKYGYPASNVTGVLEHPFLVESVAYLKQLVPSINTIGHLVKGSPTGDAYLKDFRKFSVNYPMTSVAFKMPKTLEEAVQMTKELKEQCDALFLMTVSGLPDANGTMHSDQELVSLLTNTFGKPVCTDLEAYVPYGALCAVGQSGYTQGAIAVKMLKEVLAGKALLKLPITRNFQGKRLLNVTVMKKLNIKPNLSAISGAELVRTAEDGVQ